MMADHYIVLSEYQFQGKPSIMELYYFKLIGVKYLYLEMIISQSDDIVNILSVKSE